MELTEIIFAQRQRLAFIDFCLMFRGHLTRHDLLKRFQVGLSAGSRDFNLYKSLAPDNLIYDLALKRYLQTQTFRPLFEHDARKTLMKLANDISDGFDAIGDIRFPVEAPSQLNVPDIFVVARLVQAILNSKPVSIIYTSLSSGSGAREIVPHSIVDNGLRWHVRAYDRKSDAFRDFVLTRIAKATLLAGEGQPGEDKQDDHQWVRMMPLHLIPHPHNVKYPTAIEMDYGMENGRLKITVRAAMAGYLLRRWNVDCTASAGLRGPEYQLYLENRQTLYGAENLAIAPGYLADC
ncbi:WYL domain-containing protein [Bowmanella dokdonensis]|uniref:WYL domain-containing protein n=1 Tax=Bowmanella dokdonensis TaxID=751969 RepID=A0A939IPR7_9ALTE|nr:WYL domain-containing protein [Bowmanella dokdonensis]MBN7824279.1 WYL domain-containing protein [Bowmanella dokdonensis]